jgi:isocitrate dehydrogenase
MLVHIQQHDVATKVHNAWLKTIEDGVHTYDIFRDGVSKTKVGTKEFADAIIKRIGQKPEVLQAVDYHPRDDKKIISQAISVSKEIKDLVGVDVFIDWDKGSAEDLGQMLTKIEISGMQLTSISNRGAKVWPEGFKETFCSDLWRCRYEKNKIGEMFRHQNIVDLLVKLQESGFDYVKTENLYNFDGEKGYSA